MRIRSIWPELYGKYRYRARRLETSSPLVESISPPGIGSPLHRHIRADQAIYVLEGELEIVADSESFSFAKGETCLIRRGAPHREINSSRSETRFITIHSPGFFSEVIRLAGTPSRAS